MLNNVGNWTKIARARQKCYTISPFNWFEKNGKEVNQGIKDKSFID